MALRSKFIALGTASAVLAAVMGTEAEGSTVLDLTGGAGSSGTINGAIFEAAAQQAAGTGMFGTFLRIDNGHGYNTSSTDIPSHFDIQDGGNSLHTRDLLFGEIGTIDRDGTDYLGFRLDVNEPGGAASLISLDALQIYTNPIGGLAPDDPVDLGALRYDLGAGNAILLDAAALASLGSGTSDMDFYVPLSNFAGVNHDEFVYLYAQFGLQPGYEAQGGFEEFSVLLNAPTAVPTPTAAGAGLVLLTGMLLRRRCRAIAS